MKLYKNQLWPREHNGLQVEHIAGLMHSMLSSGFSEHQPIVVSPDGEIRFGHCRALAWVLSRQAPHGATLEHVQHWLSERCSKPEVVKTCVSCGAATDVRCPSCGKMTVAEESYSMKTQQVYDRYYLTSSYNEIVGAYDFDEQSPPIMIGDELSEKDVTLLMVKDNLNRADDDVVGLAKTIHKSVMDQGATLHEFAELGISEQKLAGMMVVAELPPHRQRMFADGTVSLITAQVAGQLTGNKRQAAIESIDQYTTIASMRQFVKNIKEFSEPSPTMLDSPVERNKKKLFTAIKNNSDEVEFWMRVGEGMTWKNCTSAPAEDYFAANLGCDTCPLNGLMSTIQRFIFPVYPCQGDNNPGYCLRHGQEIEPPFTLKSDKLVTYSDKTRWFPDFETANSVLTTIEEVVEEQEEPEKDSPIVVQRQKMARWMEQAQQATGKTHPLATLCSECVYHTEGSPVADDTVPHCQRAAKRDSSKMEFLVSKGGYQIPLCHGYAPLEGNIAKIVPDIAGDMSAQMAWMIMGYAIPPVSSTPILNQLSGAPLKTTEKYGDWLTRVLEAQKSSLTPGQMLMIAQWAIGLQMARPHLMLPSGLIEEFKHASDI